MLTYSFIRISSKPQERGSGIERQRALCNAIAERHGWTISELPLAIGQSAYKGRHLHAANALGQFIARVEAGEIRTPCRLLVESCDRLSRLHPEDGLALFTKLARLGVVIHAGTVGQDFTRDSWTTGGAFVLLAELQRAHSESKHRAERRAGRYKADAGKAWIGLRPRWIDAKGKLIPRFVEPIREMFRRAASGESVDAILKDFRRRGVPCFSRNGLWSAQVASHSLFNSQCVLGVQHRKIGDLPDAWPAVVDVDTYWSAKAAVTARKPKRGGYKGDKTANLFTGVIFMEDGKPLALTQWKRRTVLRPLGVDYATFEHILLEYLRGVKLPQSGPDAGRVSAIEGELTSITERVAEVQRQIANLSAGLSAVALAGLEPLLTRRAELESERDRLRLMPGNADPRSLLEAAGADRDRLKTAVLQSIGNIVVVRQRIDRWTSDVAAIVTFRSGYEQIIEYRTSLRRGEASVSFVSRNSSVDFPSEIFKMRKI
jgi:DNA invertase Pin-like site-specific DNA recombinase